MVVADLGPGSPAAESTCCSQKKGWDSVQRGPRHCNQIHCSWSALHILHDQYEKVRSLIIICASFHYLCSINIQHCASIDLIDKRGKSFLDSGMIVCVLIWLVLCCELVGHALQQPANDQSNSCNSWLFSGNKTPGQQDHLKTYSERSKIQLSASSCRKRCSWLGRTYGRAIGATCTSLYVGVDDD